MNASVNQLLAELERCTISYLTTGNLKAYNRIDEIKSTLINRPAVRVIKVKKGTPSVVDIDGFQYTLQHPTQMKRSAAPS